MEAVEIVEYLPLIQQIQAVQRINAIKSIKQESSGVPPFLPIVLALHHSTSQQGTKKKHKLLSLFG